MQMSVSRVLSLLVGFHVSCQLASAEDGKIALHFSNLNSDKGVVRIALFSDKRSYSDSEGGDAGKAFKKDTATIKNGVCDYAFDKVPYGEYAVKAFHDEDNSGNFVKGAFGIPKVQYAFSNNARGAFGPPSYEKAKFSLNKSELDMVIKMVGK
jgi:uncharacterized protein (DUF2141 family)